MDTQNLQEMTGGMSGHDYHKQYKDYVDWSDGRLARITRTRMVSDPAMSWWDVTYCHGVLKDGTLVNVVLPFYQLSKRKATSEIIEHAKTAGIYAKGLGIFESLAKFQ